MKLDIYTDCSVRGNKFGIGILFTDYYTQEEEKSFMFQSTFGNVRGRFIKANLKCKGNSTIGEALAIYKALQLIQNDDCTTKVRIFTDSQSASNMIGLGHRSKGNKASAKYLNSIVNKCSELIRQHEADIELWWTPGHAGVYGNEIVDKLSNKARNNYKKHGSNLTARFNEKKK